MIFRRSQPAIEVSFAEIVNEYQSMVYSIGWHLVGNRAVAEELAQDVFLKLHQSWGTIESRSHAVNWLRRAMTQRAIDHSRRARLRPRIGLDQAPEPSRPAHDGDPLLAGRLEQLLARLPERARAIVVLRFQEDMDPAEIAAVLGLSLGAVKSNLHRSLGWMRGRMERMGVTK
jgi:RNA polymerase sigma-70 factor (ECF subfamily)